MRATEPSPDEAPEATESALEDEAERERRRSMEEPRPVLPPPATNPSSCTTSTPPPLARPLPPGARPLPPFASPLPPLACPLPCRALFPRSARTGDAAPERGEQGEKTQKPPTVQKPGSERPRKQHEHPDETNAATPQSLNEHEGVVRCGLLREARRQKLCKRGSRSHEQQARLDQIRKLRTVPCDEVWVDPDLRRGRSRQHQVLNATNVGISLRVASHESLR